MAESDDEAITAVFSGGRQFSSLSISKELLDTKDGAAIAGRVIDVVNKAVTESRKNLMNKFGPAS
jgi:DNA-binding protein YbaB